MSLQPPAPLGFVGTGLMGKPMAMNLIKAGYRLTVWNRTPSKTLELISAGARLRKSPADVVRDAQAVVLMLENAALETSGRVGVTLPLTQRVRDLFVDLADSGNEMLDHSALILRLETLAAEARQPSRDSQKR
jgi:3-hydroxyisobutyrate dehydrogenase-like beta-hydroxyacid dehydrogenase